MKHGVIKPMCCTGPNGLQIRCDLDVYRLDDGRVVMVATERDDNDGQSVTNAAELLATIACGLLEISSDRLIWIEHYTRAALRVAANRSRAEGRTLCAGPRDTYDLVEFTVAPGRGPSQAFPNCGWHFTSPRWQPMPQAYWLELGIPVPAEVA